MVREQGFQALGAHTSGAAGLQDGMGLWLPG